MTGLYVPSLHEDVLMRLTGACAATAALLDLAPPDMIEEMRHWIATTGNAGGERRQTRRSMSFGNLMAREDAMPGVGVWLEMDERISYQMGTLWITGTTLPSAVMEALPGRRVREVVDVHRDLPERIADARVVKARHTGNRREGPQSTHVRLELDVPVWRPLSWYENEDLGKTI